MVWYIVVALVSLCVGFFLCLVATREVAEENEQLKEALLRRIARCATLRMEIDRLREWRV